MSNPKKSLKKSEKSISTRTEDLFDEEQPHPSRLHEYYEGEDDYKLQHKPEIAELDITPKDNTIDDTELPETTKDEADSVANVVKEKKKAPRKRLFRTRRRKKVEKEVKTPVNKPFIDKEDGLMYATDDEIFVEDLKLNPPNPATKNPVDIDLEKRAARGVHKRSHYRAIKFGTEGRMLFYEAVVPCFQDFYQNMYDWTSQIHTDAKDINNFEISKRAALRTWVLNSSLPYKGHKCHKIWTNGLRNGVNEEELDIPETARYTITPDEVIRPYDFLDVTTRLRLDAENMVPSIEKEGKVETMTEKKRKMSNVTASTIAQQKFGVENVDNSEFPRWYSKYLQTHPKSVISDLEYLNRMFVFNTSEIDNSKVDIQQKLRTRERRSPNEEVLPDFDIKQPNVMKTFLMKSRDMITELSNQDDLEDIEHNGIAVGDVIVMAFTETYNVSTRSKGQFSEKLVELHDDGAGISLLVTFLHQQYSLREQCEFSNFWREELYLGYDQFVQRRFLVHTLVDTWNLVSDTAIKEVEKDDALKKDEELSPRDVFSSKALAFEDVLGEASPLYFKGNVTYVMLYDKGDGVNQHHRLNLDVLAVVTKTEDITTASNIGVMGKKEVRISEKRNRLIEQLKLVNSENIDEEAKEKLRDVLLREKVNDRKRRLRKPSFSEGSRYSSSDSEDSVLTEHDSDLEEYLDILEVKKRNISEDTERLKRMEEAKQKLQIELSPEEQKQMEAIYTKGSAIKQETKATKVLIEELQQQKVSWITSTKRGLGRHKVSIFLLLLAIICCIVVVALESMITNDPSLSFDDEVQLKKVQFGIVGLAIFCFILSSCLFFIKIFNENHLVDSRTKFLETALEGKNFVVSNEDIEAEVDDSNRGLNTIEGIRIRKNHRIIVLITNFVTGDSTYNAIDTKHTVSNTIGNITRIADATFKVDFELNEMTDNILTGSYELENSSETFPEMNYRPLRISSVQEISNKNVSIENAVHLAQNDFVTIKTMVKHDTTFHYANFGTKPKQSRCQRTPNPLVRYLSALFSVLWVIFCAFLLYEYDNMLGFQLLSLLILPALFSSWENPLSLILGWYFSMHFGPSGGLVGRLLVSSHKSTYMPSLSTYFYSILVTLVPLVYVMFRIGEKANETGFNTTVDDLTVLAEEPLTQEVLVASIVVSVLVVVSNISYIASFSRRFYLECLEIMSKPNCLFQRLMSLYFAIEWVSLRTETSLFMFNISTKDSRLLLSELADLGRFFTSGDEETRHEKNGFGVPIGIGNRGKDALWGLIDKKTRDDVVISPIDPGFKSIYFQASGCSVFAAVYYSRNFYRNSVVGLRNASFDRLKAAGATVQTKKDTFIAPKIKVESSNDPKKYQPVGSFTVQAMFWHLGYILGILIETALYMPVFVLYLCAFAVSTVFAAVLISPVGLMFMLFEAAYTLISPNSLKREVPNNFFLQLLAFYGVLVLLIQMLVSFWVKLILNAVLVTMKILFSKLSCKNIEYFVTPKLPLFFLPPLSVTDIEEMSNLKRKRLFKASEGGYWSGTLPFFAELPLFPKCQALTMNLVDVRESGDCVVRGKVRNNRAETVGYVDQKNIKEVGLTR